MIVRETRPSLAQSLVSNIYLACTCPSALLSIRKSSKIYSQLKKAETLSRQMLDLTDKFVLNASLGFLELQNLKMLLSTSFRFSLPEYSQSEYRREQVQSRDKLLCYYDLILRNPCTTGSSEKQEAIIEYILILLSGCMGNAHIFDRLKEGSKGYVAPEWLRLRLEQISEQIPGRDSSL
jgi:hypothetical protein